MKNNFEHHHIEGEGSDSYEQVMSGPKYCNNGLEDEDTTVAKETTSMMDMETSTQKTPEYHKLPKMSTSKSGSSLVAGVVIVMGLVVMAGLIMAFKKLRGRKGDDAVALILDKVNFRESEVTMENLNYEQPSGEEANVEFSNYRYKM